MIVFVNFRMIENQIQKYFEIIELETQGFQWGNIFDIEDMQSAFNSFIQNLKSNASLYPEKNIKNTPIIQLMDFLNLINNTMTQIVSNFNNKLNPLLKILETQLFQIFTIEKDYLNFIELLNSIKFPDVDYNFIRFFYSQIINRWVDISDEGTAFDIFITDAQKSFDAFQIIKQLFLPETISLIRKNEHENKLGPLLDKLEKIILLLPHPLDKKLEEFMINYITLVHEFKELISFQYQLEKLDYQLVNNGIILTDEFSILCKNQIEKIKNINFILNNDPAKAEKFGVKKENYLLKIKELEEMIFGHNNILDYLKKSKWDTLVNLSLSELSENILNLIECIKNNISHFTILTKKLLLDFLSVLISAIEWWTKTKKIFVNNIQLNYLMTEPLQFHLDDIINKISKFKQESFRQAFSFPVLKKYHLFLYEFNNDLIPTLTHFQTIHKTTINAIKQIEYWPKVEELQVLKNGQVILGAVTKFFERYRADSINTIFIQLQKSYDTDFKDFYNLMSGISKLYLEEQQYRFSKPDIALEKLKSMLSNINQLHSIIYNIFTLNLDLIAHIQVLETKLLVNKLLIVNFDSLILKIVKSLSVKWDYTDLHVYQQSLEKNIQLFTSIDFTKTNITLYTEIGMINNLKHFLDLLKELNTFWNDSPLIIVLNLEKSLHIAKVFNNLKTDLQFYTLLISNNNKDLILNLQKNMHSAFDTLTHLTNIQKLVISTIIDQSSRKLTILDRKNKLTNFLPKIKELILFKALFQWLEFDQLFKNITNDFIPKFIAELNNYMAMEENWQKMVQNINKEVINLKDWSSVRNKLLKTCDTFLSRDQSELLGELYFKLKPIVEERRMMLMESSDDIIPAVRLRELCYNIFID